MTPDARLMVGRRRGEPATGLVIAGDPTQILSVAPADLQTTPRTHRQRGRGWQADGYEGVLVGELLKRAGVPLGKT